MYLKKLISLRHTVAFRLTIWYAGIFTISSFAAFLIFYLLVTADVHERRDQDLLNEITEFSSLLSLKGMDILKTQIAVDAESEGRIGYFSVSYHRMGRSLPRQIRHPGGT